jgi:hypothetical protein
MKFKSVLIVLTEACHVGCQHCGYIGSKRDGEVEPEELSSWVEQVVAYGVPEIIFTGGEAFERFEVLESGVRRSKELNTPSAVFTSSFWAVSREAALERLSRLDGLQRLYLSTDVYHQKRVPVGNVRNAIDAAIELKIPNIRLEITYATEFDRILIASYYEDYQDKISIHADRVIPNPKFSPKVLANQDTLLGYSPVNYKHTCWLGTPLINPDGNIFACHVGKAAAHADLSRLPYFLGSLRTASFASLMGRSERRSDYQFLRTHGPKGVATMVVENPEVFSVLPTQQFTTACDMCMCTLKSEQGSEFLPEYANHRRDDIDARLVLALGEALP